MEVEVVMYVDENRIEKDKKYTLNGGLPVRRWTGPYNTGYVKNKDFLTNRQLSILKRSCPRPHVFYS